MSFFALNLKAFKKIFLLLFVATLLTNLADQYISQQVENAVKSTEGISNLVYFFGGLSLITSLIFPTLLILICLFGLIDTEKPFLQIGLFFKNYFNQLMIESLRVWGKVLQWSLLLIIPGVIRYFFLTLVPFVVTQSRTYERGDVDAIELSTQLVKKNFWKIFALVFIFHFFLPLVLTSFFDEYRFIRQTPVACLLLSFLDAYLLLFSTQCFWVVFRKSLAEAS